MSRGRPFEPGNKLGRGRPKGSPNKKTFQALEVLQQNAPALIALAINKCRDDPATLRMLASQIGTGQKEPPVKIARLPLGTAADLDRASEMILRNTMAGQISPSEGHELSHLIALRLRILISQEFDRRLSELEGSVAQPSPREKFTGTHEDLMDLYRKTCAEEQPGSDQDWGGDLAA